jgi:glutamyl-tRNA synthetase
MNAGEIIQKHERDRLPELDFAKNEPVITRVAPNPSGFLHIGHARAIVLCNEYAKQYGGKFHVRLEDTDPRLKKPIPEAYSAIVEDIKWLGCNIEEVIIQSKRLEIYYEYAKKLIKMNRAYVCTCSKEQIQENRENGTPCSCRSLSVEENLERWNKMSTVYKEGEAVLRIKTDLNHQNKSVRDWIAFRIVDEEHPLVGKKYRVWPLYNFSCAIDDHLQGITLIIRGKEHQINAEKQKYIYLHFQWKIPHFIEYGLLKFSGFSHKSDILKGMKEGQFSGWDDIRLPTLKALRRRGIQPEAIRDYMINIAANPVEVSFDWEKFYTINKRYLNRKCNRYFFVSEPIPIQIKNWEGNGIEVDLHPEHSLNRGKRFIPISNNKVYISSKDLPIVRSKTFRLRGLGNFSLEEKEGEKIATYIDDKIVKGMPKIQWVSEPNVVVEILNPNGTILKGIGEPALRNLEVGTILQFERVCYARLDSKNNKLVFLYTCPF